MKKTLSDTRIKEFQKKIHDWYRKNGRHTLPWRTKPTPYRVLISEVMLQQTQVDRVIPYFEKWMREIPDFKTLATISTHKLLSLWQGLGYNSRALRLRELAKVIVKNHGGKLPHDAKALIALPGIGPYTASAIRIFAYNEPDICIETNIRRVMIAEFFKNKTEVSDTDILPYIDATLYRQDPRTWYGALMDYGSHLPKVTKHNANTQSKHYTKQKPFEGSVRKVRGLILKIFLEHGQAELTHKSLITYLFDKGIASDDERISEALDALMSERFLREKGKKLRLQENLPD